MLGAIKGNNLTSASNLCLGSEIALKCSGIRSISSCKTLVNSSLICLVDLLGISSDSFYSTCG